MTTSTDSDDRAAVISFDHVDDGLDETRLAEIIAYAFRGCQNNDVIFCNEIQIGLSTIDKKRYRDRGVWAIVVAEAACVLAVPFGVATFIAQCEDRYIYGLYVKV